MFMYLSQSILKFFLKFLINFQNILFQNAFLDLSLSFSVEALRSYCFSALIGEKFEIFLSEIIADCIIYWVPKLISSQLVPINFLPDFIDL